MVRIHLDDQMDSKGLMGAYICTARPGEFVWQPGPLTQVRGSGRLRGAQVVRKDRTKYSQLAEEMGTVLPSVEAVTCPPAAC
jgi:hypothetical protein